MKSKEKSKEKEEKKMSARARRNLYMLWAKRVGAIVLALIFVLTLAMPMFALSKQEEQTIEEIIKLIQQNYSGDTTTKREKLMEGLYKGLLEQLDPYSTFLNTEEYAKLLDNDIVGIGVYIETRDDYVHFTGVIQGSPAEKAGVKAGDILYRVEGISAKGMNNLDAANKLRGEAGTKVKFTVKRGEKEMLFEVVRAKIEVPSVTYEIRKSGIGYIALSIFDKEAAVKMYEALEFFQKKKVERVILDLRNNGGGYLDSAVAIASMFLPKDSLMVSLKRKHAEPQEYKAIGGNYTFKLAVLVNENSASASEILAGSLKAHNRATLVGAGTYGKGTVQNLIPLSTTGYAKLTTGEYYVGTDIKVNGVGVEPHIVCGSEEALEKAEAHLLEPVKKEEAKKKADSGKK